MAGNLLFQSIDRIARATLKGNAVNDFRMVIALNVMGASGSSGPVGPENSHFCWPGCPTWEYCGCICD